MAWTVAGAWVELKGNAILVTKQASGSAKASGLAIGIVRRSILASAAPE